MNRKIWVALAAIALTIGSINAQEVIIGVKGGLNVPKIGKGDPSKPLSEGYTSRMAAGAGLFATYQFNKTWGIQVGLEYSGQGGENNGMQAMPTDRFIAGAMPSIKAAIDIQVDNNAQIPAAYKPAAKTGMKAGADAAAGQMPNYLYYDVESVSKFNYLMLPVMAKVGWNFHENSPWRVYVQAGLFGSYMFKAERVQTGTSAMFVDKNGTTLTSYYNAHPSAIAPITTDPTAQTYFPYMGAMAFCAAGDTKTDKGNTQDITDDIKDFNFGFIGAAGLSYTMAKRHSVFFEAGGNYGFIKIQKDENKGQNRIGAGTVMLGYSYTLGRNNNFRP